MSQLSSAKSTNARDVSSHLINPLNTPSGPNTSDYFTTRRGREVRLHNTDAILANGTSESSVETINGSLLDLPNEIISHILELGFFEYDADHSPNYEFRTLASQVSRKLHNLVLRTPALWSVVQLSFDNVISKLESLPVTLQRSMEYPLTVRLSCYWDTPTTEDVMDKILPHTARWEHASLTITNDHVLTLLEHRRAPFLEYLSISFYGNGYRVTAPPRLFSGHLPRLRHLCLRHVDIHNLGFSLLGLQTLEIRGYGEWPTYARLNEILGGSSNLHDLILHVGSAHALSSVFPEQSEDSHRPQILLPELRRMTVHTSEWLTLGIAELIRLFSCPKLELLSVRACYNAQNEPQNIMVYARDAVPMLHIHADQDHGQSYRVVPRPMLERFPHHLFLHTCSLYAGNQALPGADLTTLELHQVQWPKYLKLKEIFTNLKNLTNFFIYDLNPKRVVLNIIGGHEDGEEHALYISDLAQIEASIIIPHLEYLKIEFNRTTSQAQDSARFYTAGLLRIFSLPALKSFHVKNVIDTSQWNVLVDIFGTRTKQPSKLTALALTNMTDIIPTDPQHPCYTDLAAAFPNLCSLALDGVGSANALLQQLLPPLSSSRTPDGAWSRRNIPLFDLQVLSLCNTPHVSKPLLHRVVAVRGAVGRPLSKLVVDTYFTMNHESLAWLRDRVEELEVRSVAVPERH
ncbi:hypothetical protein HYPSUDRAFT_89716 [Hypholoma sublateritium FD-334 SS-4]|uniref:Uncharacterized protein n=1 Tax=Hypholoma sublateritium (strain FD-334 SS-4) TaxID=945553 RepID=A0A0D2KWA9_HYPSF|nr:hypothetical protein HYPSUDRAFT_89716 [Hypholoma sublateritium FD-334 SS-4]